MAKNNKKVSLNVCAISDLHGYLPEIKECDILLICGDIVPLKIQNNIEVSYNWFIEIFINWCINQSCKKVLFIGGNHDFFLEKLETFKKSVGKEILNKICYIPDFTYVFSKNGIEFYIHGNQNICNLKNWAFYDNNDFKCYENIPERLDILITHDAPTVKNLAYMPMQMIHAGNKLLFERINKVKPKLCLCGHIHEGEHKLFKESGIYYNNVSLLDDNYKHYYKPFYFTITKDNVNWNIREKKSR